MLACRRENYPQMNSKIWIKTQDNLGDKLCMWFQKTSFGILCTGTQPSWFAILKVFWAMLKVKMPKAYKIHQSLQCFREGMKPQILLLHNLMLRAKPIQWSCVRWHWNPHVRWNLWSCFCKSIKIIRCIIKNGIPKYSSRTLLEVLSMRHNPFIAMELSN